MEDNFSERINSCGGSNPLLCIFRRDIYYILSIHRCIYFVAFVGPVPLLPVVCRWSAFASATGDVKCHDSQV